MGINPCVGASLEIKCKLHEPSLLSQHKCRPHHLKHFIMKSELGDTWLYAADKSPTCSNQTDVTNINRSGRVRAGVTDPCTP